MSAPGHCRHCEHSCRGAANGMSHRDGIGGTWRWRCPACAEAERIANAIAEAAGPADDGASRGPVGDAILDTYLHAWTIAVHGRNIARGDA